MMRTSGVYIENYNDTTGIARGLLVDREGRLLRSSNVEILRVKNVSVPAETRSTVTAPTRIAGYSKFYILARTHSDLPHDFEIWAAFYADFSSQGTTFGQQFTEFMELQKIDNTYGGVTDHIESKGGLLRVAIWNRSEQTKNYDVVVMGVN